jgi:SAM-dependent methyltransferase
MIIRILLLAALALIGWRFFVRRSKLPIHIALVATVLGLAGLAVLFPESTNDVAHAVGVGRGADLITYLVEVGLLFVIVHYYTKFVELEGLTEAVGVDLADDAIAYARRRYARAGVKYEQCDALAFHDPAGFDTAISLETVEHVPDPARLIAHLVSLLCPGGVLVASVPTTPSVDVNPHHLHDFTERSLHALVAPHGLVEIDRLCQVQRFSPLAALRREESRMADMRRGLLGYYARHPRAALRRLAATVRYGFTNRYATLVWRRPL